jgi:hypothetical protein
LRKYSIIHPNDLSRTVETSTKQFLIEELVTNAQNAWNIVDNFMSTYEETTEDSLVDYINKEIIDPLADRLNDYWAHKVRMAPGSDPTHIKQIFKVIDENLVPRGYSLCGAGAGGFMTVILKEGQTAEHLKSTIDIINSKLMEESKTSPHLLATDKLYLLTLHSIKVDQLGISSEQVNIQNIELFDDHTISNQAKWELLIRQLL